MRRASPLYRELSRKLNLFILGGVTDLIVCMFILGCGMAMYVPNMPKALGAWFERKDLGMANGICISGMGIGGALVMATAKNVLSPNLGGWRGVVVVFGCLVLTMAILWMILYKDKAAGTAVGFIFMLGNTGGFMGPVVAGKLMDVTGNAMPGFIFVSTVLMVAAGFIVPLKETGRKRKSGEAHRD